MKQGFYKHSTLKNRNLTIITLLLTLLVLGGNMAWGQWAPSEPGTYRLRSRGTTGNNFDVYNEAGTAIVKQNQTSIGDFSITNGTYRFIFENTRTIIMTHQIAIGASAGTEAHLIMELGTPPSGTVAHTTDNPTLRIADIPKPANGHLAGIDNSQNQYMAFYIPRQDNAVNTQHTITIKGNPALAGSENISGFVYNFDNNFVIDGSGPKLELVIEGGDYMNPKVKATKRTPDANDKVVASGMFRIQHGSLTLENVTFQHYSSSYSNANLIQVYPNRGDAAVNINIDHCYFYQIGAKSNTGSPVLRMQSDGANNHNNNRSAVIQNCKFGSKQLAVGSTTAIDNGNGTIRTVGNNKVTLGIYNTHITHNYGCPVRWHGCMSARKLEVHNCRIEESFTCLDANVNGGGGLLLKGPAEIRNSTIRNNWTQGDGGGIYLSTYTDFSNSDGNPSLIPDHSVPD